MDSMHIGTQALWSGNINQLFIMSHILTYVLENTTRIPEMLGRFLNLNKMKTKSLSNHMSQYCIHNRT